MAPNDCRVGKTWTVSAQSGGSLCWRSGDVLELVGMASLQLLVVDPTSWVVGGGKVRGRAKQEYLDVGVVSRRYVVTIQWPAIADGLADVVHPP
jgi:hypothetical protein